MTNATVDSPACSKSNAFSLKSSTQANAVGFSPEASKPGSGSKICFGSDSVSIGGKTIQAGCSCC